jgi:hypothetical protein
VAEVWTEWREHPVDRFGVVLFFVIATIVVSALVEVGSSWSNALLVTITSGAALVAAGRAAGLRLRWRRVGIVVVLAAFAFNATLAAAQSIGLVDGTWVDPVGLVWLVLLLSVPVIVIRRIVSHTDVAMRTVLGAVVAYLQIAVAYSVLFQAIDGWSETPFFGTPQPSTSYMYVSLTTISTLGLGDLVPSTALARLVLSSESVLGQVFLVTVVAVVVSRFAEQHRPR